MKALFTFVLLAFLAVTPAFAQAPDSLQRQKFRPETTAGVLFGVNVSSLNKFNSHNSRLGLFLGFAGEYQFHKWLGIATELNYTQQGTSTTEYEYQLNYLKLPLLLTFHDNGFFFQGGLYGAVLLKGKSHYGNITENITGSFTHTDLGYSLGGGYAFYGNTLLGVRYNRGFDSVNESLPDSKADLKNSTVHIYAGYTF